MSGYQIDTQEVIDAYNKCAEICEHYAAANWSNAHKKGNSAAKECAELIRHALVIKRYDLPAVSTDTPYEVVTQVVERKYFPKKRKGLYV